MKTIEVLSMTASGTFLYCDSNQLKEGTFEGLVFEKSMLAHHIVRPYISRQIECKFGKNGNKIRYGNIEFYEDMLKLQAAKLNLPEFEDSKLFSPDQKQKLIQASTCTNTQRVAELSNSLVDYKLNRKLIPQLFTKTKNFEAKLIYLHDQICVSFELDGLTHYLPLRLRDIDQYFQLIDSVAFCKFFQSYPSFPVSLVASKYNLVRKQYEIDAVIPEAMEKAILLEGWGTVALKNLNLIKPQLFVELRKCQQQAKTAHKGIFAKPFEILSLVYTKNNLVAVVEEILEGYIYKIRAKNDEVIKIEMAKIYCPLGNEAGAFACRQFARKNLIGREVNVFLTKDEGLNILGSIVRFSDNKDIESLMIENGYGFVKEELKGTMFYAKLETLEKKAKDFRKGIHNQKSVGYQFYEDFTVAHSKKEKLEKKNTIQSKQDYLRQSQAGDEGVVDKCIDPVTFIVRIDSHKKIIKLKLEGISKLVANPRLPEVIQLQKTSETYCHKNFYQRTVSIELSEYNQATNCFVGTLRHTGKGRQKISFQQNLLSQGFTILSNNGFLQQKWVEAQRQAEAKQIGCWSEKLRNFVRKDIFQSQPKQFMGKFSWVEDGEKAYVQPQSMNQKLEMVYQLLSNKEELKPVGQEDLVAGYLCAAEYLSELCRARIISIEKNMAVVKFIDWGNKETVPVGSLRQIPTQLQYLPPLCCEVELDIVGALKTRDPDHLQRMRQFMMESDCKFVKSYANIVNAYMGSKHINTALIYEGYVKADLSKIPDEGAKVQMMHEMNRLRKELVGVWDLESGQSDLDENDYD